MRYSILTHLWLRARHGQERWKDILGIIRDAVKFGMEAAERFVRERHIAVASSIHGSQGKHDQEG